MTKVHEKGIRSTDNHKQAEENLKGKTTNMKKPSFGDVQSIVHELEVHQTELEIQNEELRRAQIELEEAHNRYSDLYDFAPISYFTFDKNGSILEVNLTGAKKLGRERANLIKKLFSLYVAPNHKDAFYSHLRQVFDTETQTTCELRIVDNKGNIFDAKLESIPVRDSKGNLVCRTAISDITERKRAEAVSQEARIYAESIINTVREPFVALDKDLKVLSANRSFYSTFEVTADETVGNLIYDIGDRQWDIPSLRTLLEEILPKKTEFINYEVSHKFQTIGQKIMLLNARQIYQEVIGTPIILLAVEDITERKRVEEVSQEARKYAENIIETVREPLVVLDKDLKVLSANHSFYSTFEVTPDETVGNLIYDIGNRQWDIPSLRTLLEEILPTKTQFLNYEVSHKFQTIGQKIMLLNARQIYQEVIGTPIILLAIEDITERKRAEEVSQEARKYAESIIDTVREPFVALDKDLKVISANRSFYSTFEVTSDETVGNLIYDIGNRQWDIPSLRTLLEEILPTKTQFLNYEVSHKFQTIGQKTMLLNARQIYQEVIGTPIILLAIEDITERKWAEKVSKEARLYAESIIDTVREPFVVLDKDLKVLSASRSFYSTFEVTADETVGNLIYDIGNRQWDIPSLRMLLEEILPTKTQFTNYEVSHKFQTIGQKTMLLNARQIYQEVIGTPIILLAIEDITERKRVEEVSQEARKYAENIIETVREPLVVLDKDLKVLSANHSFYSTFEVTSDETVGNLIYDIGNRQWDISSLRTLLEEILPKKTEFIDYEVSHKFQTIGQKIMLLNARQIYQEVIGTPIILLAIEDITEKRSLEDELSKYRENIEQQIEERTAELKIANEHLQLDITKRMRAEKALRESEERYRYLVEFSPYGIAIHSNCKLLYLNVTGAQILGAKNPEDFIGKNVLQIIHPDYHDISRERIRIQEQGKLVLPLEEKFLRFDGTSVDVEFASTPFTYMGKLAIYGVFRDITERKKAEEVQIENLRLEAADKAKSEFLASMSHELRTPLNSIIGFSEIMKLGMTGKLDEKQKDIIDTIYTSSNFLLSLINDILDLSKIEAGKIELGPEKMSVPVTIKETLNLMKEKAMKHKVFLKTEFDPELEFIEADKQRFKQILFNLLSNAVKFSKEEGGTITITAKKEGDMAQISVSDTGIGIKEENIGRLFHKFEQLDSGISKKYGGTGLGLSITKQLVELHGGRIWAESKYGEGSAFIFMLPLEAKKEKLEV